MFTERELQLILEALDSNLHDLTIKLVRQEELSRDVTSLREEQEELGTLTDKVSELFLET